jgi:SAM-dependent methyltransferase
MNATGEASVSLREERPMSAANPWYRDFFSGVVVDNWLVTMPEEETRAEVDFIEKVLGVHAPDRLLDVPCGGGRHSLPLVGRGYHLTGVDLSGGFLDAARKHSTGVTWEQRDMRDLPWSAAFDGAFSFGNSFGYLDDAGNADFLRAVAGTLKPGARFVLDTSYLTEGLLPVLQERSWYEIAGVVILSARRYDPATGRLHVAYTYIRDGQRDTRSMSARLYTYREVHQLFEDAGFTEVQGFGSLAGEPFRFGSRRLLLVGTKKAG